MQTILVPPLLCSALVYEPIIEVAWAHGSVAVADTRHDDTITGMATHLLRDAPEKFTLLGTSMGGYVALEVIRQAPHRVQALALVSTTARADTPEQLASRDQQSQLVEAGQFDGLVDAAFRGLVAEQHEKDAALLDIWRALARTVGARVFLDQQRAVMGRVDVRELLPTINCPTVVIHGADDRFIPREMGEECGAAIPGAQSVVINGAGHFLSRSSPKQPPAPWRTSSTRCTGSTDSIRNRRRVSVPPIGSATTSTPLGDGHRVRRRGQGTDHRGVAPAQARRVHDHRAPHGRDRAGQRHEPRPGPRPHPRLQAAPTRRRHLRHPRGKAARDDHGRADHGARWDIPAGERQPPRGRRRPESRAARPATGSGRLRSLSRDRHRTDGRRHPADGDHNRVTVASVVELPDAVKIADHVTDALDSQVNVVGWPSHPRVLALLHGASDDTRELAPAPVWPSPAVTAGATREFARQTGNPAHGCSPRRSPGGLRRFL
ncbi:alpha/beta fold hydrolase [Pengzhenrongella sicca]|uniref:Alpha/beta fold hydrolase n=1 Tax=Pengzhenrongella sicca TaxID=2819238 RepID=A0A8A4ZKG6_9MICO|nr:alpha/beta fold hydrolase [Pengzhenrongella sicca]